MADPELVKILQQGSDVWNRWREAQPMDIQIDLSDTDLSYADLKEINLCNASLGHADLHRTNLYHANLNRCNLQNTDMRNVRLSQADLSKTKLSYADLSDADLNTTNLIGSDLSHANLSGATMIGTCLRGASLHNAYLSQTILKSADLSHVDLSHADLTKTDLNNADLYNANMRSAKLNGTKLKLTNLNRAKINDTTLTQVDLRTVKGLIEIDHQGPSLVSLYTVQLPQDGSALHFLRGAGVPDEWIDDYRARMMNPIQYYSCFISHSSQDSSLARRLHADLQAHGVRCWFAPEDMKIGDKIRKRIDEAIHIHEKLLLLLSEHALASNWVEDEVEAALEKEQRQQREVLFPIRLDNAVMETTQAWAAKLRRQRHIGDFTQWTGPQAYEQAFERLLRDLKKNAG